MLIQELTMISQFRDEFRLFKSQERIRANSAAVLNFIFPKIQHSNNTGDIAWIISTGFKDIYSFSIKNSFIRIYRPLKWGASEDVLFYEALFKISI